VFLCLYVHPIVAKQRIGKHVPVVENAHATIVGRFVFYAARVISTSSLIFICVFMVYLRTLLIG
jgi:hypothetical protein